jgi:hypothetical protein
LTIKHNSEVRRSDLILFAVLLLVDIYRVFLLSSDSPSNITLIVSIIYYVLNFLFLISFIRVAPVALDIPSWAIIAGIVVLVGFKIPFLLLGIIVLLDILTYLKVKRLMKENAEIEKQRV